MLPHIHVVRVALERMYLTVAYLRSSNMTISFVYIAATANHMQGLHVVFYEEKPYMIATKSASVCRANVLHFTLISCYSVGVYWVSYLHIVQHFCLMCHHVRFISYFQHLSCVCSFEYLQMYTTLHGCYPSDMSTLSVRMYVLLVGVHWPSRI